VWANEIMPSIKKYKTRKGEDRRETLKFWEERRGGDGGVVLKGVEMGAHEIYEGYFEALIRNAEKLFMVDDEEKEMGQLSEVD